MSDTLKSAAVKAGTELAGAFVALFAIASVLGPAAGDLQLLSVIPWLMVAMWWGGRWRQSGKTFSQYFSMPVERSKKNRCPDCDEVHKGFAMFDHYTEKHGLTGETA